MTDLLSDLHFTWRSLRRAPGFALTTITLLALAFAANATMFSVAWNGLYRPLPFPDAAALVNLNMYAVGESIDAGVTPPLLNRFAKDARTLSAIAGWRSDEVAIKDKTGGADLPLSAVSVEPKLFDLLGLHPVAGRLLTNEDASAANGNILVAQSFAESRYGSSENALDETLDLKDGKYRIVGVMPANVAFARDAKLWLPLVFSADELREQPQSILMANGLKAIARIAPTAQAVDAEKELTATLYALAKTSGIDDLSYLAVRQSPLRKLWSGGSETALNLLLLAVLLVFAVTGANVCNLYLARLASRQQESALLAALGASPARRWRLLLIEAAMLVAAGAAIGIACLPAGLTLLDHFGVLPQHTPFALDIDATLIGYLATLAALLIVAMTLLGFGPSGNLSRLYDTLKQGGARQTASGTAQRGRAALIVAQVALTVALLTGAGLLIRSAQCLLAEDVGFDREHLVIASTGLFLPGAAPAADRSAMQALRERVATIPGVSTVGMVDYPPFSGNLHIVAFQPPGNTDNNAPAQTHLHRNVDEGYFAALGQPVISGRAFEANEVKSGLPVAIVDTRFARKYFPHGDAVGQHFRVAPDGPDEFHEVTIVGVVNAVTIRKLDEVDDRPTVYLPGADGQWLVIRSAIDPGVIDRSIGQSARDIVPGGKLAFVANMKDQIAQTISERTRLNQLLELLAAVALLLACVGLYAVMAYSVRMRTNEFGIRIALGAQALRMQGDVLKQGLRLVAIGLLVGLPLAYAAAQFIASQLYHVAPFDPLTLFAVATLIAAIGLAASWWPARNAARVDPIIALRQE